jgi:23S rRNA (cytosine1962-C5)-methyltransferase
MKLFCTQSWHDYELIDSGNFQKLERFGQFILIRPEPKAIWDNALSYAEWKKMASAEFKKIRNSDPGDKEEQGEWFKKKGMPDQWYLDFPILDKRIRFKLGLTPFRHVGIFPEQADNWKYIYESVKAMQLPKPKVLNLFAYTGGASLVARLAGADVAHVEALKQLIGWTKQNMELSGLDGIRWVLEDAVKYVKRELRRGNHYNGIILDPPAYGRGPDGEKWILEEGINELLKDCAQLLDPDNRFMVLNLYAKGNSPLITENLFNGIFGKNKNQECGELYIEDAHSHKLPYGSLLRYREIK